MASIFIAAPSAATVADNKQNLVPHPGLGAPLTQQLVCCWCKPSFQRSPQTARTSKGTGDSKPGVMPPNTPGQVAIFVASPLPDSQDY